MPLKIPQLRTRVSITALAAAIFCFFFFVPSGQAQSVGGLRTPDKDQVREDVSPQLKAARGQAPLKKLYDYLRVEPSTIRHLPPPDTRELQRQSSNKAFQIGVVRPLQQPLDLSSESIRYDVPEGEVRVAGLVSEGALSTRVHFTGMSLPVGARVFVYSISNPDEYYGPYEGHGLSEDGTFWTPPMAGDGVVIEYFTPQWLLARVDAPFTVSEVSHIFKDALTVNGAGACNVEVPSDWSEVAKSVGYLEFTRSDGEYACTGTLLNTQSNDQTPYLLTANHCFDQQAEAQSLRVYWFYNTGDAPPPGTPHTDGANLLATGPLSDFTFVRLTGTLPGGLFFSGWDANTTPLSSSVAGIHHPEGSHKRISFGTTNSTCSGGLPGPCSNFTHVRWNSGTTEAGSSGSGLWKGSGTSAQFVGTLTGGDSSCTNPAGIDHYGNFSVTYPNIASFLAGGGADLSLTKSMTTDLVTPGSKAVYLITVSNNLGGTASSISVTDNLPPELTFLSCSATGGTCGGAGNNRTVTFPSLAAGTSATAILITTVNNSVPGDTLITNSASVSSATSDPNPNNNSATTTAIVTLNPTQPRANGKIAFGSDRAGTGESSGIYTINANGSNQSLLFNIDPFASSPAWSPNGAKIAYGRRYSGTYGDEIYVANADGTGSIKVAGNVYSSNTRIAWSPNGTKLAFIGTGSAIHVVNPNGTGLAKLPNSPAFVNDLSWSPDGSMFAYTNGADVWIMNIDGSGQTNLTQGRVTLQGESARCVFPRWSPNGARILFGAESNNYKNIYIMNADGTGLAPLITQHQSMQPTWSPDGSRISFIALNALYVANSDGTGITALPAGGFYNFKPDWQPLAVAASPTVQLSASSYTVNESSSFATINVTRSGDTSTAATVKYSTSDATDVNFQCNPSTPGQPTGAASRKCDYHIAVGRLRFAPGETTKQIVLSVVDDVYVEGSETLTIALSNPTGASLGTPSTATITIADNDAGGAANPIDGTAFYVRQLYVDLLSREPDPAGLQGWINRIDLCGQPGQAPPPCDRVTVGGDGFLRSGEFFDRQFFVIRLYRTALGRILRYDDVGDLAYVSGFLTDADLELNKQELVADIMSRSEFGNRYNGLNNSSYVDTLIQTAGATIPQSVHDGWVTALNNSTKSRGQVYRELSERTEVSNRYLHEAQVVSCYYGFFTRNPDGAYFSYLDRLDRGEITLGDLANAFINASEYRQRFGQ